MKNMKNNRFPILMKCPLRSLSTPRNEKYYVVLILFFLNFEKPLVAITSPLSNSIYVLILTNTV